MENLKFKCNICQEIKLKVYFSQQRPYAGVCLICGHLQYLGAIIPSGNDGLEFDAYLEAQDENLEYQRRSNVLTNLKNLSGYMENSLKLIDIGAGSGKFLRMAQLDGFSVTGNEISLSAAEMIEQKYGIKILVGDLRELKIDEKFNFVTMFCVLAHVVHTYDFLGRIREILEENGILYFHTPRICLIDHIALFLASVNFRKKSTLLERRVNWEHKNIFSKRSMQMLIENSSFEVIKMNLEIGYGLQKRCYFESMGINKSISYALGMILDKMSEFNALPRNVFSVYTRKSNITDSLARNNL